MMADMSFSWNDNDIKEYAVEGTKILIRKIDFPLRQAITRHKVEIPGRPGSWDFGGGVKQDYHITIIIAIIGKDVEDVVATASVLESAFAAKGDLILSFWPSITHRAMVYDEIPMELEGPGGVGRVTLNFECDAEYEEEGS